METLYFQNASLSDEEAEVMKVGSVLDGKYKILNQIGEGGMSTVYLAMNEKANRQWAVKEIKKKRPYNFALMKQGILREMALLRSLSHPMIPRICDVIEEHDAIYIVMDYIEGKTLRKLLEEEGAQEERYVIEWAKQLCQVLAYLHSRIPPVIYRDMKPSNIMLKPNGDLMLIDFGISREFCREHTEDTICLGTQGYAAPEQYGGGQSDERTDLYGLGATLHHMVTGESPNKRQGAGFLPIRQIRPELSEGLEQIIKKCLEKNPEDRYQSSREVWYALGHYQELGHRRMRRQKRKLFLCGGFFLNSFFSLGLCLFFHNKEQRLRAETYEFCLQTASNQEGEEKIELLRKAIEMEPGKEEGYLKLVEEFLRDGNFSQGEDLLIRQILNETNKQKETQEMRLKRNRRGYEKVAYELGTAYFFFYEEIGSKERSLKWFEIAEDAEQLNEVEKVRAGVCARIANYWKEMGRRKKTGDFTVSHAAYFRELRELYRLQKIYGENEIMILKVCQETVMQILQYGEEMMREGVEKQEIANALGEGREELEAVKGRIEVQDQELAETMEEEIRQAERKMELDIQ